MSSTVYSIIEAQTLGQLQIDVLAALAFDTTLGTSGSIVYKEKTQTYAQAVSDFSAGNKYAIIIAETLEELVLLTQAAVTFDNDLNPVEGWRYDNKFQNYYQVLSNVKPGGNNVEALPWITIGNAIDTPDADFPTLSDAVAASIDNTNLLLISTVVETANTTLLADVYTLMSTDIENGLIFGEFQILQTVNDQEFGFIDLGISIASTTAKPWCSENGFSGGSINFRNCLIDNAGTIDGCALTDFENVQLFGTLVSFPNFRNCGFLNSGVSTVRLFVQGCLWIGGGSSCRDITPLTDIQNNITGLTILMSGVTTLNSFLFTVQGVTTGIEAMFIGSETTLQLGGVVSSCNFSLGTAVRVVADEDPATPGLQISNVTGITDVDLKAKSGNSFTNVEFGSVINFIASSNNLFSNCRINNPLFFIIISADQNQIIGCEYDGLFVILLSDENRIVGNRIGTGTGSTATVDATGGTLNIVTSNNMGAAPLVGVGNLFDNNTI